MSLDLSKLSAAPWVRVRPFDVSDGSEEPCTVAKCWSSAFAPVREIANANANFIVLARNAFDVMMRRGWVLQRREVDGIFSEWYVIDPDTDMAPHNSENEPWSDPFTALVEADRWLRERERVVT